jgi:competence protein ComEC
LGVFASFQISWILLLLIVLFWIPLLPPFASWNALAAPLLSIVFFISTFFYSSWMVRHPSLPEKGMNGSALLDIAALTHKNTSYGNSWNYQGKILRFVSSGTSEEIMGNIPVTACLPDQESLKRPHANCTYLMEGKLKRTKMGKYIFYPKKNYPWQSIGGSWSPAEWRYQAKQAVNDYIKHKISREPVSSFLTGIATGDFENRLLSFEFSRFGLQHIMAISGFHFTIVASILGFLFSLLVGRKVALISLMILMTLYFLFLGSAPSVIRAWVSCMLAFSAFLVERPSSGLNALGVGLLAALIWDPELVHHIGFQFSFVATAAILIFYSPFDAYLQILFPKRRWSTLIDMNGINQHGFIVLSLFRQALALSLAVNLAALPITFYYFQKFPLMSILYNLFFPGMVSLSMLLLIAGFIGDLFTPYLGNLFHYINENFTQFVLDYTHALPRQLDIYFNASLSQEIVIVYLTLYFCTGMYLWTRKIKV